MKGKVAIVTGAGQGIGFAIAQALLARGVRVLLNDQDAGLAAAAVRRLEAPGTECAAFAGDVSDIVFIRRMVDEAVRVFGRLDIAVANAGLTVFGDFFSYEPAMLERVMRLNLAGSFFLAQAAAMQMRAQGEG